MKTCSKCGKPAHKSNQIVWGNAEKAYQKLMHEAIIENPKDANKRFWEKFDQLSKAEQEIIWKGMETVRCAPGLHIMPRTKAIKRKPRF